MEKAIKGDKGGEKVREQHKEKPKCAGGVLTSNSLQPPASHGAEP
jgi:hypothetical protein